MGTAYCGFQVQKNGVSVAEKLQDAIERVFGERLDIKGCSRTDAGVHANMFCFSFKTEKQIPCENIISALNVNLPYDISAYACREMPDDFHARYSARGKEYIYLIDNSKFGNPFYYGRAYHYKYNADAVLLNSLAHAFEGKHDFTGFCSTGSDVKDKVRTVYSCCAERQGDLIAIKISGDGFLYNMVRIIAGTIVEGAQKGLDPNDIKKIIESKNRTLAGKTLPACGLYLNQVFYDDRVVKTPWQK